MHSAQVRWLAGVAAATRGEKAEEKEPWKAYGVHVSCGNSGVRQRLRCVLSGSSMRGGAAGMGHAAAVTGQLKAPHTWVSLRAPLPPLPHAHRPAD